MATPKRKRRTKDDTVREVFSVIAKIPAVVFNAAGIAAPGECIGGDKPDGKMWVKLDKLARLLECYVEWVNLQTTQASETSVLYHQLARDVEAVQRLFGGNRSFSRARDGVSEFTGPLATKRAIDVLRRDARVGAAIELPNGRKLTYQGGPFKSVLVEG